MRDEISDKMNSLSNNTKTAEVNMMQFKMGLTVVGGALTSVGALINRVDSPLAKSVSTWLMTAGAIFSTTAAIVHMIPMISTLISSLKSLAIMQTIVKALSGPTGWLTLAGGVAIGATAAYGISTMTSSSKPSGVTINNYVAGSVVTERQISDMTRRQIVITQGQNAGKSGIK